MSETARPSPLHASPALQDRSINKHGIDAGVLKLDQSTKDKSILVTMSIFGKQPGGEH